MEKCVEYLNMAKDELKNVDGSDEAIATIDEAIAEVEELYNESPENSMNKEEQDMADSGKYAKGKKSGIMIEIKHIGKKPI